MSQDTQETFVANIRMDEGSAAIFLKGLGKLTVEEAGDLTFLFKQTFLAQKEEFLKKQQEAKEGKEAK